MNRFDLLNIGSSKLKKKNISSYNLDSELLLSKVLNKSREEVLVSPDKIVDPKNISKFNNLIKRRLMNEPIAYIFKEKEFWSKKFKVDRNTLIPRPETELMVEKLVGIFKGKNISILDIGTGCGCILISLLLELKHSRGVGIDISRKALSIARKNLKKFSKKKNLKFYVRKINQIFNQKFDLVVSNPPYISRIYLRNLQQDVRDYEPKIALDGGNDGLDLVKKVIYKAKEILKVDGLLALELDNKQYLKVSKILIKEKFIVKDYIKDYRDNIRCIIAKLT